ncbi:uncharacterized protein KRP23_2846 [Phytophthora ramorum]|uniref:uncharacterized protein n=1 Tax=Phytophthora ramorum TaxID=164328 RepID=UPI00309FF376|nr:hypothetical protein KRP23_2846 [Phytophthora ramorum]
MVHPIVPTLAVASVLSSMALLAPTADAHQVVLLPEPQWTTDDKDTKYNPLAFLESEGFTTQEDFASWRDENGYKSLRDFMDNAKYNVADGADFSCGFTDPKGTPQPIPAGNAMRSTGYTHDGPCEVWLDDTMVLDGDNCHEKFPGKDYTVDYSSCKGTCTLRWYWLGIRFLKNDYSWQVYKECIPLTGGSGTSESAPATEAPSTEGSSTGSQAWGTPTTAPPERSLRN